MSGGDVDPLAPGRELEACQLGRESSSATPNGGGSLFESMPSLLGGLGVSKICPEFWTGHRKPSCRVRLIKTAILLVPQWKPQAVTHQILRPCFIADLPGFPGIFLKYNRGKLQYGSFSYPPSKKISLQMRVLLVICHNIDFAWGVEGCDTLSREYEYIM